MARRNRVSVSSNRHEAQNPVLTAASPTKRPRHPQDQQSIQPAQGTGTVPTTPVKRSLPFQRYGFLGRHVNFEASGDSPQPLSIPTTPQSPPQSSPPKSTPTSLHTANVGVRRARQNSALLASPARPGYASRMRQMFQDASTEDANAQLCNTSRKCCPTVRIPAYQPRISTLPVLFLPGTRLASAQVQPQARTPSPMGSSESWSGDSDYLVTERPLPAPSSPSFSLPIKDWLATVSSEDDVFQEDISASDSPASLDMAALLPGQRKMPPTEPNKRSDEPTQNPAATSPMYTRNGKPSQEEPSSPHLFHSFDDNLDSLLPASKALRSPSSPLQEISNQHVSNRTCTTRALHEFDESDDGGIELIALNPNVCTERGPSRYRSLQDTRSPLRTSRPSKQAYRSTIRHTAERSAETTSWIAGGSSTRSAKTLHVRSKVEVEEKIDE